MIAQNPAASGFSGTDAIEDEGQHLQPVYPPGQAYGGAGRFAFDERAHLTESSTLVSQENLDRLLAAWNPHWDLTRPVLVEKSPPNLVMTRFLQAMFPGARFVIIIRNPVVVAMATKKWAKGQTMARSVRHWVRAHEVFRSDVAHLEDVRLVRYEDLAMEPATILAQLTRFLDLPTPIEPEGFRGGLSSTYLHGWDGLRRSRRPWDTAAIRRIERAFPTATDYGYTLDDLASVGPLAPDLAAIALGSAGTADG